MASVMAAASWLAHDKEKAVVSDGKIEPIDTGKDQALQEARKMLTKCKAFMSHLDELKQGPRSASTDKCLIFCLLLVSCCLAWPKRAKLVAASTFYSVKMLYVSFFAAILY